MLPTVLLLAALTPAQSNLDFAAGKLTGWEGDGFELTAVNSANFATSARASGKAILHRTFTLPANAVAVQFQAAVVRPDDVEAGGEMDFLLEAANREYAPRQVRGGDRWINSVILGSAAKRQLRDYRFAVEKLGGKRVRVALVDSDERPGCYVIAGGFRVVTRDEGALTQFATDMQKLTRDHNLGKMTRYDSKHFMALSNADAGYSEYRLHNCETIHGLFFEHFNKLGFGIKPPAEKMMVAIFDTPAGLEAYLGQKMSEAITGVYHTPTNRLVVYDYGKNKHFLEGKKSADAVVKKGASDLDRERRSVVVNRFMRDRRDDTNISTVMHEVAHQLSFNTGMLNPVGDVPVWLAEGLAVYCESTVKGAWQGIGEPNPSRAGVLAQQLKAKGEFYPLRSLVTSDDWIRKATKAEPVILGYSQSWALFRLLAEERPKQLRQYLKAVYPRRTPEHRLADFAGAFGDVAKLEARYREYLREVARKEGS